MLFSLTLRSLRSGLISSSSPFTCANQYFLLPQVTSSLLSFPSAGDINFLQSRNYAARKGTRIKRAQEARRRAIIRKSMPKPEKKRVFGFGSSVVKDQVLRSDPTGAPLPMDDVYYMEGFVVPSYSFKDALQMHREAHSPTMWGNESALLHTRVELYMKHKKKTKFQDSFSSTVTYPHKFELARRSRVVAITKNVQEQEAAKAAGAILAGGEDIIRNIKSGLISNMDYEHLVVHTDMLIPLTAVRGILGDNFPSKSKENYGTDMVALVKKFVEGYDYQAKKNIHQDNFGYIDLPIGTLNMEDDQLAANLLALLKDAERCRLIDAPGQFPETVWLISQETGERFKTKFWCLNENYVDIFNDESFSDQVAAILKSVKSQKSLEKVSKKR